MMLSRRSLLHLLGAGVVASAGFSSYALAIEPRFRLLVTQYRFVPPRWPKLARPVRIAAVADIARLRTVDAVIAYHRDRRADERA
jgi:uncharacterized protein